MQIFPDSYSFAESYDKGAAQCVWTQLHADMETPVSACAKLLANNQPGILLESVLGGERRGRYSIIGLQPDLLWRCEGDAAFVCHDVPDDIAHADWVKEKQPPLQSLRALLAESHLQIPEALPPMAAGVFGYLGYDMVQLMETLPNSCEDTIGIPDGMLMRPQIMAVFDAVAGIISLVTPVRPSKDMTAEAAYHQAQQRLASCVETLNTPLNVRQDALAETTDPAIAFKAHTSRAHYYQMVERAKEYIRAGDIFQVVPSQRFSTPFPYSPLAFYRALRHLNPSPFLFYLNLGEFQLIGSSPEILVRLRDGKVTVRPIAGTRMRGATEAEDRMLEADLLADEKEIAEHLMLLDLGRNDVGRVAKAGTVTVTEKMIIERYSHVIHIVSNVEGDISPDKDMLDALIAGFPAGTVSGAPKIRAMEIIDGLETEKRKFYAGCVGYFSADGAMDSCIALRTALLKDGTLYAQAGGGVVADSDPDAEYQESCNKAKAVMKAAELAHAFELKK